MVRLLNLSKNIYTAGGYMAGTIVFRGKYVAILKNGIKVNGNWLNSLDKSLERMPWVVASDTRYKCSFDYSRFKISVVADLIM